MLRARRLTISVPSEGSNFTEIDDLLMSILFSNNINHVSAEDTTDYHRNKDGVVSKCHYKTYHCLCKNAAFGIISDIKHLIPKSIIRMR
jgi:hypothetical protein